ncbi:copper resistance protein CopB [Altererythrobacter sp. B11]|uniref:copper resistance protein B n=1 Tax=Altererythrobacter sp. B11 TaxID=2060312 RepID=UPI000DC73DA4|nr:copper resistance protein B [Altererythrobacter sp. B11]BBC71672.1 copper resistance protein CopB [Altererythrobacter sp. B11]
MRPLIALMMLGVATPAVAQHAGHSMPMGMPMPKPTPTPAPKATPKPTPPAKKAPPAPAPTKNAPAPAKKVAPAKKPVAGAPKAPAATSVSPPPAEGAMDHSMMDHGAMDQGQMDQGTAASPAPSSPEDHGDMDMGQMNHSQMDMSGMDHSKMDMGAMAMPIPEGPPPAAAGSGPPRAADAIWGAEAMRGSREALRLEQGGQKFLWFMADRAEYQVRQGKDGYLWDVQGYYGGDINKIWFKSEGEGSFGEKIESAETQALYSRAISPWFYLQTGLRQDFAPRDRTYGVIGIQGLMPYRFDIDAAAFLSDKGDLTARFEGELDQRVTQRLILQPRAEVNLAAQDIPELGIGAGLDTLELGVRLRYEIAREFAPYIGIEQAWKIGQSADYARARGDDPSVTNYVVGVRFWF